MASKDPKERVESYWMSQIRAIHGFEHLASKTVRRWAKPSGTVTKTGGGRRRNPQFDLDVYSKLVITKLDTVTDKTILLANVMYQYDTIKKAAKDTVKESKWKNDITVNSLKFSNKWVINFLRAMKVSRLRVTNIAKVRPSSDEVQKIMEQIQTKIETGIEARDGRPSQLYGINDVLNCDETANRPSINPLYQLIPEGVDRASSPLGNDMLRLTTLLGSSADGVMLPPMHTVKCTISAPDLTSSTVLSTLHKKKYTRQSGWELKVWERNLSLKDNKMVLYKRPYLLHSVTKTVITVQHKAWMDTIGLCMWADLIVKPWAQGRNKLLVWDNCKTHTAPEVTRVFKENNIEIAFLPKNMTDKLQVMDLVVNGPLKARMRKIRCEHLYEQLQVYKKTFDKLKQQGFSSYPPFRPRVPTIEDGIDMVMEASFTLFQDQKFKTSVQRTFVKVGLTKNEQGKFVEYREHNYLEKKEKKGKEISFDDLFLNDMVDRGTGQLVENFDNREDGKPPETEGLELERQELADNDDGDDDDDDEEEEEEEEEYINEATV